MELLECIKDDGYHPQAFTYIKNFPVKGGSYTIRGRHHTQNGLGYLLEEIKNPIMCNGKEPSFSAKRFKKLDTDDSLYEELIKQEVYEY